MGRISLPKTFLEISKQVQLHNQKILAPWEHILTWEKDNTPSAYDAYPLLFTALFPPVDQEQLVTLCAAGSLQVKALLALDRVIDLLVRGVRYDAEMTHEIAQNTCSSHALQFEASRLLQNLFPFTSPFWDEYRSAWHEVLTAMYEEKLIAVGHLPWSSYTEDAAIQRIMRQNALAKVAISALSHLTGEHALKESLMMSIDHYNVARQLFDDLVDWKEDVRFAKPSLLLARVLTTWPPQLEDTRTLSYRIYFEGHATYILGLALQHLEMADKAVDQWQDLPWRTIMIGRLQEQISLLRSGIEEAVSRNLARARHRPSVQASLTVSLGSLEPAIKRGLNYLVEQWRKDFGEAKHIFYFPKEEFRTRTFNQMGDIFARAIILENLLHIRPVVDPSFAKLMDYEMSYILSRRRHDEVGGWAYFPDLKELPPDADDLAQIMHILVHMGRLEDVVHYCEPPLQVLLANGIRKDGSIETWIVPKPPRTPEQQLQEKYVQEYWGDRVDIEVMANVIYALAVYDGTRFRDVIERGLTFLEREQNEDGSWHSTWYHGPFYGTWVVMRALHQVRPTSSALTKGKLFLLHIRNADGGWGLQRGNSDPLSTSLAMMALHLVDCNGVDYTPSVEFLISQQNDDGGWDAVPFIRMKIYDKIATYKSRVITTAYVLRTLINITSPNSRIYSTRR